MTAELIYSDDDLLVVNKPAGIASTGGGWGQEGPSLAKGLESDFGRIWIVHRLDKGTSGLIVFARNAAAHRAMSLLFESHRIVKTYHALVCGLPSWKEESSRLSLRVDVGHSHRTAVDRKRGVPALHPLPGPRAISLACPPGGSTGDGAHAPGPGACCRARLPDPGRLALRSAVYGFDPQAGACMPTPWNCAIGTSPSAWTAPYPPDFAKALDQLRTGR